MKRLIEITKERQVFCDHLVVLNREEEAILAMMYTVEEHIDFSMFKDTTNRLLLELWNAPNKMLSHEEIKEYVMFDPEAPGRNVRRAMNRAREALRQKNVHCEIKNIRGKGYQLVMASKTLLESSQTLPEPLKPNKNGVTKR